MKFHGVIGVAGFDRGLAIGVVNVLCFATSLKSFSWVKVDTEECFGVSFGADIGEG
jgi:hypothetical protein